MRIKKRVVLRYDGRGEYDTSGYNADTVDELIDKTRQAVLANFDFENIPFLLHQHYTTYFVVNI